MARLIFAIIWTAITLVMALSVGASDLSPFERAIFLLFPVFGAVFTWFSWQHVRRRRSLRTETVGGVSVYIWVEWNGRECRSTEDPRPGWDAADGDSDGDGGD